MNRPLLLQPTRQMHYPWLALVLVLLVLTRWGGPMASSGGAQALQVAKVATAAVLPAWAAAVSPVADPSPVVSSGLQGATVPVAASLSAERPPAPTLPPAPLDGAVRVERVAGELVIEVTQAPRLQVVRALAAATDSELVSAAWPISGQDAPISLRWRGHDVARAWDMVLGSGVNHARRCQAQRCAVWLLAPCINK